MDLGEFLSEAAVRRLPGYYRHLKELEREGVRQVSSADLGQLMGQTPSLVRQDISSIGGFGRQGFGYDVVRLRKGIGRVLGLDREHAMIILGAGSVGSAVARYPSFYEEGFRTLALFDVDPARIGSSIDGIPVLDIREMEAFVRGHEVDIAVLAVPSAHAQKAAELVCALGIRAIWNFAPVDLALEEEVTAVHVHLSDSLQVLSYEMEHRRKE